MKLLSAKIPFKICVSLWLIYLSDSGILKSEGISIIVIWCAKY